MFASDASPKEAATAIGVSVPTLRKYYFAEVAQRDAAALRMDATQLARLNNLAAAGNVAAEKELAKRLDKLRVARLSERMSGRQVRADKPVKLGKKEAAKVAAKEVGGKFAVRQGPTLLNPAGNA